MKEKLMILFAVALFAAACGSQDTAPMQDPEVHIVTTETCDDSHVEESTEPNIDEVDETDKDPLVAEPVYEPVELTVEAQPECEVLAEPRQIGIGHHLQFRGGPDGFLASFHESNFSHEDQKLIRSPRKFRVINQSGETVSRFRADYPYFPSGSVVNEPSVDGGWLVSFSQELLDGSVESRLYRATENGLEYMHDFGDTIANVWMYPGENVDHTIMETVWTDPDNNEVRNLMHYSLINGSYVFPRYFSLDHMDISHAIGMGESFVFVGRLNTGNYTRLVLVDEDGGMQGVQIGEVNSIAMMVERISENRIAVLWQNGFYPSGHQFVTLVDTETVEVVSTTEFSDWTFDFLPYKDGFLTVSYEGLEGDVYVRYFDWQYQLIDETFVANTSAEYTANFNLEKSGDVIGLAWGTPIDYEMMFTRLECR